MAKTIDLKKDIVIQDGGVVSLNLIKKEHGNSDVFALDSGQKISEHSSPYDAMVVILEGKMRIIVGGKSHELDAEQVIIMPANIPHALEALSVAKMLLVMLK